MEFHYNLEHFLQNIYLPLILFYLLNYLNHYIIPFNVICTKADKFAKTKIKPEVKRIADRLALGEDNLIAVSNENSYGKEKILLLLDKITHTYNMINSEAESESEDGEEE